MGDDIRVQIFRNLNQKGTEELIEIWQHQDHEAWTDTAFELIENILQDRIGDLSGLSQEYLPDKSQAIQEIEPDDELPLFYQPEEVENISIWLDISAIVIVALVIISGILNLFLSRPFLINTQWLIYAAAEIFDIAIQCIIYYFPLKALSKILYILMEMEIQSRPRT